MAYTKPLITTTVYYHDGESPAVFADAITDGKTTRAGSTAREQLLNGDTVDAIGAVGEGDAANIVIPYHSVIYATYAKDDSEAQTKPTDDFCE